MTERQYFLLLLDKFPVLDLAWSEEMRAAWLQCWRELWAWACRLAVEEAIDAYVEATKARNECGD